jgi:hypothetical protein
MNNRIHIQELMHVNARAVPGSLRAVGTVLRAAAGLDREQTGYLALVGVMVLTVRPGSFVYKINKRLLVKISYFLVRPPLAVRFCHMNGFCSNIGEFVA